MILFKSSEKLKVLKGVYIAVHVQNKDYGHFWKIIKEFLFSIRLMFCFLIFRKTEGSDYLSKVFYVRLSVFYFLHIYSKPP